MARAIWNGAVIAESDDIVTVEGNVYFPRESLDPTALAESAHTSVCSWKGTANYYSLVVDGAENRDAVWYYANPKDAAEMVAGRVAFWKGVTIETD